ncbi:MAG: hypothetical protein ACI9S8_000854, partial [Chlamydiales bacterium]
RLSYNKRPKVSNTASPGQRPGLGKNKYLSSVRAKYQFLPLR